MKQSFDLFINFDGECREAAAFYANVFKSEVLNLMTYAETPPDPSYPLAEADKDKIMYACVPIFGCNVMFMDMPTGMPLIMGNNINPTISIDDKEEIRRIFQELSVGGEVGMEPQKTFFNEFYCMVTDKFGIVWQILFYEEMNA